MRFMSRVDLRECLRGYWPRCRLEVLKQGDEKVCRSLIRVDIGEDHDGRGRHGRDNCRIG